jgi:hypothetical protein
MRLGFSYIFIFLMMPALVLAQGESRGSIPEELFRPRRDEAPRYPIDTVIGELGQGTASNAAFSFANSIAEGFLSGQMRHSALSQINSVLRENYLSQLENIEPQSFRLGGGREEADGAISFLIRFIGKEYGITGELYIRFVTREIENNDEEASVTAEATTAVATSVVTGGNWVFEDLLLEDAKSREVEQQESASRYDFLPYERFF